MRNYHAPNRTSHTSRALLGLFTSIILAVGLVSSATQATAVTWLSKLCTSFSGCNAKGMGNAGYQNEYLTSHWGMDAGHNCTNYTAYRLIHNGIDASYLRGQGMAYQWGDVAAQHGVAVDGNPRVGDIAWFRKDAASGLDVGHVAYVESIDAGAGKIRVSEDAYDRDFDWRDYYIRDVSGFIHFSGSPSPSSNPFGYVDTITSPSPGLVRVGGWAADPDAKAGPLAVHVYANDKIIGQSTTGGARPDVANAYPGYGTNLGYDATFAALSTGSVKVCVYAINAGAGDTNTQLGCKTVNVADPNPFGSLDIATATAPGTVKVGGWMADTNDKNGPIVVHFYGGDPYAGKLTANKPRPDVPVVIGSSYGSNLGFSGTIYPRISGQVNVCAYGINVGTGWDNTRVGCKTITVADPNPFGDVNSVTAKGSRKVAVRGWAADPNDKNGPVKVRLYANGKYVKTVKANKKRADVKAANPGYGSHLGFSFAAKLPSTGTSNVCVVAIDKGAGWINTQLKCIQVTVR